MNDPAARIHTALLRFRAKESVGESHPFKPRQPEQSARQLVVVNEQNLAALSLSSLDRHGTKAPSGGRATVRGD
jgi:hypothetical protein